MSILNELNGKILPFTTLLAQVNNAFCYTFVLLGVIACVWLLATNLFQTHSASTKLLLSTIFADLLFCGTGVVTSIINQIKGGYSLGEIGCIVNYYCIVTPACVSVSTLGVVAWDRYQIVCKGNQWSNTRINLWILGVWGFFGFAIATPIIRGDYSSIRLEPNSLGCNVKWYDRSPQSLFISLLIIVMAGTAYSVVAFSYSNVYMTYRAVTKKKKAKQDNQKIVFYKCVAMTLCLVVSWTPYYTKIFYEFILGKSTNADWTSIGNISALLCSSMNPIILCLFDNRVRGNMLSVSKYFKRESIAVEPSTDIYAKTVLI